MNIYPLCLFSNLKQGIIKLGKCMEWNVTVMAYLMVKDAKGPTFTFSPTAPKQTTKKHVVYDNSLR